MDAVARGTLTGVHPNFFFDKPELKPGFGVLELQRSRRAHNTAGDGDEILPRVSAMPARRAGARCRGSTAGDPRASPQRGANRGANSTRVSNPAPVPR